MKRFGTLLLVPALALLSVTVSPGDSRLLQRVRQRLPIKLGTSGGPADDFSNFAGTGCLSGTLGAAVTCGGVLHVLSNSHVFCRTVPGEAILQPGLLDTACQPTGSVVARYAGELVPLGTGNVDAGIATAVPGAVDPSGEILDIGVPCANPVTVTIGMIVAKSGRGSGLTMGTVQAVDVNAQIGIPSGLCPSAPKFVNYKKLFAVAPNFLVLGDSGSLLVTNDANHNPVGYLAGFNPDVSFWSPAQDVIKAFEPGCGGPGSFRFVGRSCTTTASSRASLIGPPDPEVAFVSMVKDRHVDRLMSDPAVLAVGVGASDRNPNEAVIVVYRQQGRPLRAPIPSVLDGVKVKMIDIGPIVPL